MRICVNGVYRDMTDEEIAEWEQSMPDTPAPEPTAEERLDEIEAALIELAAILGGDA